MKKYLIILLALIVCSVFTACSDGSGYKAPEITVPVTLGANGGTAAGTAVAVVGKSALKITAEPVMENCTVEGYYSSKDCDIEEKIADGEGNLEKNTIYTDGNGNWTFNTDSPVTLYPKWEIAKFEVGGRIFYIGADNGATYKFYDKDKKELEVDLSSYVIETSRTLDSAVYYSVENKGAADRIYVANLDFDDSVYLWASKNEVVANTDGIGTGKTNTETLAANADYNVAGTIWKAINDLNGDTGDWFIPANEELEILADLVGITSAPLKESWEDLAGFFGYDLWSSTGFGESESKARFWEISSKAMNNCAKNSSLRMLPVRSF
ncbi:MAG: hypothetical protein MJ215_03435 [Spirochaetia bacterium]|nr:hypothetical protein [Spirochaetia bacterium]